MTGLAMSTRPSRRSAPTLLVFTKLDLWPELATHAASRGARVAMVAATVSPVSGRLRWPALPATRSGYEVLDAVGAITAADGARMSKLGARAESIELTGDPRIDSVLAAVAAVDRSDPLLAIADPALTLVAGSTWPADEAVLLPAFAQLRTRHPVARLIVVPHEPTADHLDRIDADAARLGLPAPVRLGAARPRQHTADRRGRPCRDPRAGSMPTARWPTWAAASAKAGIHSVLEPAGWGRTIVIGPRDRGSRDVAAVAGRWPDRRAPRGVAGGGAAAALGGDARPPRRHDRRGPTQPRRARGGARRGGTECGNVVAAARLNRARPVRARSRHPPRRSPA
ncbi:MAG: glycosyltransferase N-terminal domain-containing protein [Gemmatimonadales bacterium]